MNVEIGTKATQFPEKEYINGIFLGVNKKVTYIQGADDKLGQIIWKHSNQ
jgi:hypothetical protein